MGYSELRRYTNLPSLLHILKSKKLTLLDPNKWDDSNDSFFINEYKNRRKFKTLLALCFTETSETYHHWHVFGRDMNGVCITFNKEDILNSLDATLGFAHGQVNYKSIEELKGNPPGIEELPYIKNIAYNDEREYRILYKSGDKAQATKEITIQIEAIRKITLSPWLPQSLTNSIKETIREISESQRLNRYIVKSTLTSNRDWKDIAKKIII